jgi:hypothetical protein
MTLFIYIDGMATITPHVIKAIPFSHLAKLFMRPLFHYLEILADALCKALLAFFTASISLAFMYFSSPYSSSNRKVDM